jgi:hypothetical protein
VSANWCDQKQSLSVCVRSVQPKFLSRRIAATLYDGADAAQYYNSLSISVALSSSKDLIGFPLACCDFEYRKRRAGRNLCAVNILVLDFSLVVAPSKRALEYGCGNYSTSKKTHQEQTSVLRSVSKCDVHS